ncbi:hypothetical protein BZA05DRAFT_408868 [Tricharina praecox]|uniref:uncharacterized protein n=1 Tax=Tricharina praecox TaxID=43433 RepID=UPI00221F59B8|nr:uncharacterized protein BZA05DRAFT_408868 [Tricharina praecox]KAI5844892.1 hypothetical protein BZA05DRAFT_408868 [Tricharina praecox]
MAASYSSSVAGAGVVGTAATAAGVGGMSVVCTSFDLFCVEAAAAGSLRFGGIVVIVEEVMRRCREMRRVLGTRDGRNMKGEGDVGFAFPFPFGSGFGFVVQ